MREIAPENLVGTAIGVISTCNYIIGKQSRKYVILIYMRGF